MPVDSLTNLVHLVCLMWESLKILRWISPKMNYLFYWCESTLIKILAQLYKTRSAYWNRLESYYSFVGLPQNCICSQWNILLKWTYFFCFDLSLPILSFLDFKFKVNLKSTLHLDPVAYWGLQFTFSSLNVTKAYVLYNYINIYVIT